MSSTQVELPLGDESQSVFPNDEAVLKKAKVHDEEADPMDPTKEEMEAEGLEMINDTTNNLIEMIVRGVLEKIVETGIEKKWGGCTFDALEEIAIEATAKMLKSQSQANEPYDPASPAFEGKPAFMEKINGIINESKENAPVSPVDSPMASQED